MNKKLVAGYLLLCSLTGCRALANKEDILLEARQIKAESRAEHIVTAPAVVIPPPVETVSEPIAAQPAPLPVRVVPLPEKERLIYKLKYIGLTLGEFVITNHGKMDFHGRPAYQFELITKAHPFFLNIFKAKSRYVSYLDAEKLVVLRHEEYIKEGTLLESAVDFDHQNHIALYSNFLDGRKTQVTVPEKILDVLTNGFYQRMLTWQLGDVLDTDVYADDKIYNYVGFLHSIATVKIPKSGIQEAYRFKSYLFLDGKLMKEVTAEIFFSADGIPETP